MEYKEAVAEARQLVRRSEEDQYRLAQLTYEQTVEAGRTQRQWANDTGIGKTRVGVLGLIWKEYGALPQGNRPPFTEAYERMMAPGRAQEAEEKGLGRGQSEAYRTIRSMPPEQKAEVVREALAEPEVAERVVRDTPTRTHLAKAEHTVDREQQDTARERYELAEPRSHQIGAIADAEYALTKARQAFEDAAEAADTLAAHDWPDNSKERVEILTQRALAAGELVRAKVEGRNLDEELAALLEGGDA